MTDTTLAIGLDGLGRFMPMHLLLDTRERVLGAGPTLLRVLRGQSPVGARFSDLFTVRWPAGVASAQDMLDRTSQRFRLTLRHHPGLALRGLGYRLPGDRMILLNLTFGIDLPAAVRGFGLTDADFAATDLAMELLYLAEANMAVTGELRALNLRLEEARRTAEEEATTDPLTGLRNRRAAQDFLDRLCSAASPFGLLHVDLDFFKAVNDGLGHAAGDVVLRRVGRVLADHSRLEDCAARIGGDEFVVILPGRTEARVLHAIARRIIARICEMDGGEGQSARVSASIGIVRSTDFAVPEPAGILAAADRALYRAKGAGRGVAVLLGAGPD